MSISSTSTEPLFTLPPSSQITSQKVLEISVYNSRKVVLTTSLGSKIEVQPEGFKGAFCQDIDFLKQFQWRVSEGQDGTYYVNVLPRCLGGGNDSSTQRSKSKKANKPNSSENLNSPLTEEEKDLLLEHLKFSPKYYDSLTSRAMALERASQDFKGDLQIKLLKILLFKCKINPLAGQYTKGSAISNLFIFSNEKGGVNRDALQVFFDAGLAYKDLPIGDLWKPDLFDLFARCIDAGGSLEQEASIEELLSPFFQNADHIPKNKYYSCTSLHSLALSLNYPQRFDYIKSRPGLPINTPSSETGRTILMSFLNHPEHFESRLSWLLNLKPDMEIIDKENRTALFYLMMSVDLSIFKKYLYLLLDNGLNLNKSLGKGFNHFTYCLQQIEDLNLKNKELDLWNFRRNPELREKITTMLKLGADCSQIPPALYFVLPIELQALLEESLSGDFSSESAETSSSKESPKRLSESPQKIHQLSTNKLEMFWFQFPTDLCRLIDPELNPESQRATWFKNQLEQAFKKANLSFLFCIQDVLLQKSLFNHLNTGLKPLIEKRAHASPMFQGMIVDILNEWKTEQYSLILKEKQALEQTSLTKENLAKIEEARKQIEQDLDESKKNAARAERAQDSAASDRVAANMFANSAHSSAMSANTRRY